MRSLCLLSLLLPVLLIPSAVEAGVGEDCRFKGICLHGRVKVVQHFADIKVKVVHVFPDLKVQKVRHFPDRCGQWEFVENFPDFTVQFVEHFPDLTIQFVDVFPGT